VVGFRGRNRVQRSGDKERGTRGNVRGLRWEQARCKEREGVPGVGCARSRVRGDPGGRNTEKWESVDQKVAERFERVRAYLVARPRPFATQGTVGATSRTCRGRRLGPYVRLAGRDPIRLGAC
jgi:hypothetical protein